MSAVATVGALDTKLTADTSTFSPKMQEAAAKVDLVNRKLQLQTNFARTMGDSMDKAAAVSSRAAAIQERSADRARRAWQREVIQQNLAADAQQAAGRAAEMAALKQDILTRAVQRQGSAFAGLKDRLALTSKGVQLSARDWIGAFSGMGPLLGAGLVAGIGVREVNKVAAFDVELAHLSEKSGMAVSSLAGLREIVKEMGVDWDPVANGIMRVNHALTQAPHEVQYARALAEIGVTLKELNPAATTAEQRLNILAAAFQKHAGTAAAADAAIELFGRGGIALLPVLEAQGGALEKNARDMAAYTGVTDKSVDAAERWTEEWARAELVMQRVGNAVMPIATAALQVAIAVPRTLGAIAATLGAALAGMVATAVRAFATVGRLKADWDAGALGAMWGDLRGGVGGIGRDWKDMGATIADQWHQAWQATQLPSLPAPLPKGADVDFGDLAAGGAAGAGPDYHGAYARATALQSHWLRTRVIPKTDAERQKWYWASLYPKGSGPTSEDERQLRSMDALGQKMQAGYANDVMRQGPEWREYNAQQEKAAQIAAQLAQATERSRNQIALETGAISRHAAAFREAWLAMETFKAQADALRGERDRVANDTSLSAGARAGQLLQIDNQYAELAGRYRIEQMQYDAAIRATTGLGELGDALARTAQELTDWGQHLAEAFNRAIEGVNEQIVNAMTGKRTNFGNVGSAFFRDISKTVLENLEGRTMKMLGLGGGKKPTGTSSDPFYVVPVAGAQGSQPSGLLSKLPAWLQSLFGMGGGGGATGAAGSGLGALFGGLFSGGGDAAGAGASGLAGALAGFASGGAIPSGLPAIVGEAGPELFVPSSAGRIIPNDQLQMGGGTHHYHVSIDARGATDPAAVEAAAHRAVMRAAPQIAGMALAAHHDRQARRIAPGRF